MIGRIKGAYQMKENNNRETNIIKQENVDTDKLVYSLVRNFHKDGNKELVRITLQGK